MTLTDHNLDTAAESCPETEFDTYPRPQLRRSAWTDLCGQWQFAFGDETKTGFANRPTTTRPIIVPFPPESAASGIGDTSPHRVFFYERDFDATDVQHAGHHRGRRLMLHFGAVDFRAEVWIDGQFVGRHEGGHTPFSFDITDALSPNDGHRVVVRVEDDPRDINQPRGKQDWRDHPHSIWYDRTSGIWQPVWLESVPTTAITSLHWSTDLPMAMVTAEIRLSQPTHTPARIRLTAGNGEILADEQASVDGQAATVRLHVSALEHGRDIGDLQWSPENPNLIDASVTIGEDEVASYLGLRQTAVAGGRFLLNDRPYYVRSVLSQGFWPQSHIAAPSPQGLRDEVQLTKDLGFNAARVHQKMEDPRYLYWADRLGLLIWGEAPAPYAFNTVSMERTATEWFAAVERDRSHPCVVTWVPFNESWGIQQVSHVPAIQHYVRGIIELTKAIDPTRPVVSNDGWEQIDTDIVAIHDYATDPEIIRQHYRDRASVQELVDGIGPAGRRLILSGDISRTPIMLTEFGGISWEDGSDPEAWGYSTVASAEDFHQHLAELLAAVRSSGVLAGFCYTQLTDTMQETNGLLRADRSPKLPMAELRQIITGQTE
ncbi:MAG: glycoside hydrolase family 2 [Propionibacteriaceae bacterium]|jgi:beta-galactosidase/beta-glucuronidase|nr:glycoside hydrolase family 2 [Propionibacteriaceae bacterium]